MRKEPAPCFHTGTGRDRSIDHLHVNLFTILVGTRNRQECLALALYRRFRKTSGSYTKYFTTNPGDRRVPPFPPGASEMTAFAQDDIRFGFVSWNNPLVEWMV